MNSTVEKKWIEDFTIELRLREVRGDAIGDAVASVKELLADTGQAPEELFGTPRTYASQLELPLVDDAGIKPGATLSFGFGLLALLVYSPAIWAYFEGQQLGYSLPQLLLFSVPLAVMLTIPLYVNRLVRHPWIAFPLLIISTGAAVASALLAPSGAEQAWLQLNPLPVAVASAAVLFASALWGALNTARIPDDPIVDPLATPVEASGQRRLLLSTLPHALMPLSAVGMTVTAWLAHH